MFSRRDVLKLTGVSLGSGLLKFDLPSGEAVQRPCGSANSICYSTITAQGHIHLPASFCGKKKVAHGSSLIIARDAFEKCLHIYTQEDWAELLSEVGAWPDTHKEVRYFRRKVILSAEMTKLDENGYICIPSDLRSHATLSTPGEIVTIDHFCKVEVWSLQEWDTVMDPKNFDKKKLEDIEELITKYRAEL